MKNMLICMTSNKEAFEQLVRIKNLINLDDCHITLVSVIKIYATTFSLDPYIFPKEIHYGPIRNSALKTMSELAVALSLKEEQVSYKVEFELNPKKYIHTFLKSSHFDLIIVANRKKHGINGMFLSSFIDHLIKFSPYDVLVMQPSS